MMNVEKIGKMSGLAVAAAMAACLQAKESPEPTAMVEVAGGPFLFGSEEPCFPEDKPTVTCDNLDISGMPPTYPTVMVDVKPFLIDEHEVTNYQYQFCVELGQCQEPFAYNVPQFADDYYTNPAYRDYPVVNVNQQQAEQYCLFVGRRLPTEVEWERAAAGPAEKAEDKRVYPFGQGVTDIKDCQDLSVKLNYCDGERGPGPVKGSADDYVEEGNKKIWDLAGNVAEWVSGRWRENLTCKEDLDPRCDCFDCDDAACREWCYLSCDECPPEQSCKDGCGTDQACLEACQRDPDCKAMCCPDACDPEAPDRPCYRQCKSDAFPGLPRCISYGDQVLPADDLYVSKGPDVQARGGAFDDDKSRTCRARTTDRNWRHLAVSTQTAGFNIGFRCAVSLTCADGLDNDGDGLVDAEDPDCGLGVTGEGG